VNQLGSLLPILFLVVLFYLLVLRPARTRQAKQRAVLASLTPGTRVMTTAGLFGRITAVEDDQVELEIADGVRVRYVAAAIARVVDEPTEVGTSEPAPESVKQDDTPEG
jgi:preprotein translocase subunit YajC